MRHHGYGTWDSDDSALSGRVTLVSARDHIVDCFAVAHGDRFAAAKRQLGLPADSASVRATAEGLVRLAFSQVGGSFEHPTRESLTLVVELLGNRSMSWGVPAATVERHQSALFGLIAAAEGDPPAQAHV